MKGTSWGYLVLACALVGSFAAGTAQAQDLRFTRPGSMFLQGAVSFSHTSGESEVKGTKADLPTTNTIAAGPIFGYFVIDGLHLGLGIGGARTSSEDDDGNESITSTFDIAFVPAYYFPLRPTRSLSLYLQGAIGYSSGGTESKPKSGSSTETTVSGFAGGIGGGLAFAFGALWGGVIRIGIDYTYKSLTQDGKDGAPDTDRRTHTIAVGTGMGVYF